MRFGRIFFILVLLLCAFETARLWGIMPETLAAHFNAQGSPDRFATKIQFFQFQIQIMFIVFLVSLPVQFLFRVLPSNMVNIPNRSYWLSPERRAETLGRLNDFGSALFAIILLAIQIAFEIAAYANLHSPILFNAQLMGITMALSVVVILLMLVGLVLSFRVPSASV